MHYETEVVLWKVHSKSIETAVAFTIQKNKTINVYSFEVFYIHPKPKSNQFYLASGESLKRKIIFVLLLINLKLLFSYCYINIAIFIRCHGEVQAL